MVQRQINKFDIIQIDIANIVTSQLSIVFPSIKTLFHMVGGLNKYSLEIKNVTFVTSDVQSKMEPNQKIVICS